MASLLPYVDRLRPDLLACLLVGVAETLNRIIIDGCKFESATSP